jgi:hypothetical protein
LIGFGKIAPSSPESIDLRITGTIASASERWSRQPSRPRSSTTAASSARGPSQPRSSRT